MIELDSGQECWTSRGVAGILHVGRNQMLAYLRRIKVLTAANTPSSLVMGKGLLTTRTREIFKDNKVVVTYWTKLGLEKTKLLIDEGIKEGLIKENDIFTHRLEGVDVVGSEKWTPKKPNKKYKQDPAYKCPELDGEVLDGLM